MSRKQALRDLQARLAERLRTAQSQPRERAWLAVECAGQGLLLSLVEAGEIFALPPLRRVPHTRPWFVGVANLRGGLHGVVDLAAFLGLADAAPAETARDQARLVALAPRLGVNAALRVDRLAGLRSAGQLQAEDPPAGSRPAFAGAQWRDGDGRGWQEILLGVLASDERFLAVAA